MIDLKRYCANEREVRLHRREPFEIDGHVYATNGHLMVRVPATEYPGHAPYIAGVHPKNVADLVETAIAEPGEYIAMPTVAEPDKCKRCKGTGIDPEWTDEGPENCWDCGGSGYDRLDITGIGGTTFATHYVWLLGQLPGAQIKPLGMKPPAAIRFHGGHALLMSCRP
jgi:hypothetical protein